MLRKKQKKKQAKLSRTMMFYLSMSEYNQCPYHGIFHTISGKNKAWNVTVIGLVKWDICQWIKMINGANNALTQYQDHTQIQTLFLPQSIGDSQPRDLQLSSYQLKVKNSILTSSARYCWLRLRSHCKPNAKFQCIAQIRFIWCSGSHCCFKCVQYQIPVWRDHRPGLTCMRKRRIKTVLHWLPFETILITLST